MCLCFGSSEPMLDGYTDSNMVGDIDSRKFILGFLMTFTGGAVSWQSKLQKCVVLFTIEAKYTALTKGCKEALWMRKFLEELGLQQKKYVVLMIARVSFTSLRIRRSIQDRSILMLDILGFVMCLSQSNCIWKKYIPLRMDQTC